jgi:hypothetical protein
VKQPRLMVQGAILVTALAAFSPVTNAQEVAASTGASPAAAAPSPQPDFGRRGQWYLYAPSLQALHTHYNMPNGPTNSGLSLGVELGAFVRDHLSIGLRLDGYYSWQKQPVSSLATDDYDSWSGRAQLVVGWQRPLSSWVSFWPKLALGGSYGRADQQTYDAATDTMSKQTVGRYWFSSSVRLPLVLHLTRHLFMEAAYEVVVDSGHDSQYDSVQVWGNPSFGLGGWF